MKRIIPLLLLLLVLLNCSKNKFEEEKKTINGFYDQAFEYRDLHVNDSAFLYFNRAKDFFLSNQDSVGAGKCLVNMAMIANEKEDYFGAQELSLDAISYFDSKNSKLHPYILSNLNNLGIVSYNLGNYEEAITFYQQSLNYVKDSTTILWLKNNIAVAYMRQKEYIKSLAIYKEILKEKNTQTEYAKALSNFVFTKWLQDTSYNPVPSLLKALKIRENVDDFIGLNSNYSNLADYYTKKQVDSAFVYSNKMYQVAKKINKADDQLQALQKLIKLGPPHLVKGYFESYQKLADSVQNARSKAKNQFALIRYETEKSKADNLILQKDKTEREFMLGGSLLFIIVGSIVAIFWYRKRQQKIELETQNAIRESQLKTSKKVHDVVANGLYRVMTEIENQEGMDKEEMLDRLDLMYQKSRDISYEDEEIKLNHQNFKNKITDLLNSFNTKHTTITINGNADKLWAKVNHQAQYEIEHILQELMVNMKKHSQATQVDVFFKQIDNQVLINYTDNGIGIVGQLQYGNGLSNTGNRIKNMEGEITFDTKLERGLKVLITFPIA